MFSVIPTHFRNSGLPSTCFDCTTRVGTVKQKHFTLRFLCARGSWCACHSAAFLSYDRTRDKEAVLWSDRTQTRVSASLSPWASYLSVGWTLLLFWLADAKRASGSCPGRHEGPAVGINRPDCAQFWKDGCVDSPVDTQPWRALASPETSVHVSSCWINQIIPIWMGDQESLDASCLCSGLRVFRAKSLQAGPWLSLLRVRFTWCSAFLALTVCICRRNARIAVECGRSTREWFRRRSSLLHCVSLPGARARLTLKSSYSKDRSPKRTKTKRRRHCVADRKKAFSTIPWKAEAKQAAAAKKSAKKRASQAEEVCDWQHVWNLALVCTQAVEDDWLFGADKEGSFANSSDTVVHRSSEVAARMSLKRTRRSPMMISASGCVLAFFIRFSMVLSFDHSCVWLRFSAADFVNSDPGPVEPNRQLKAWAQDVETSRARGSGPEHLVPGVEGGQPDWLGGVWCRPGEPKVCWFGFFQPTKEGLPTTCLAHKSARHPP